MTLLPWQKRPYFLIHTMVLFGLCMASSLPAFAAKPDKGGAKARAEAGQRLFDVHDYGEALKEYKAAYLAKPDPALLFNIGECHYKLGQDALALELLQDFLQRASINDPNRRQAGAHIREIESRGSGPAAVRFESPQPPPAAMPAPPPPQPAQAPATPMPLAAPPATQPAGVDLTAPSTADQMSGGTHFYGAWWFWTGVVVVVGAAAAIVVLSRGGSTDVSGTTLGTRTVLQ